MAEIFSRTELKRLHQEGMLKDHLDAKKYVAKFYFPLQNGMVYFKDANNDKMLTIDTFIFASHKDSSVLHAEIPTNPYHIS